MTKPLGAEGLLDVANEIVWRERRLLELVKEAYEKDIESDFFWLRDRLKEIMKCDTRGKQKE